MDRYTLDKKDTVLMIIDVQEKLCPAMKYEDGVIESSNKLIEASRIMGLPILVTEQYPRGLGRTSDKLLGIEGARVFEKTSFTACTDELLSELEDLGRKKVIVLGMEAHVCVFQTVRDLLALGYQPFIVREGISSRTDRNTKNGISLIRDIGGFITNVETLLFDLMKDARAEEFKAISKIIK